ncbi:MAG TPA: hypothetical protein VLT15_08095 [Acidimicrobiia bacterium]|nr:hypothetical protein [Acidimicrobiia bacterium]
MTEEAEVELAGTGAAILLGGLLVFQLALARGAPWGEASWGGRHSGVLPAHLRIASLVAGGVIYPLAILTVLDGAGVVDLGWPNPGPVTMWVITGLFVLATVMNLASPSRRERLWAGPAISIAILCAVIALNM